MLTGEISRYNQIKELGVKWIYTNNKLIFKPITNEALFSGYMLKDVLNELETNSIITKAISVEFRPGVRLSEFAYETFSDLKLKQLDLSNLDITNTLTIRCMFAGSNIQKLILGNNTFSHIRRANGLFVDATVDNIKGKFDFEGANLNKAFARFNTCKLDLSDCKLANNYNEDCFVHSNITKLILPSPPFANSQMFENNVFTEVQVNNRNDLEAWKTYGLEV